MSKSPIMWFLFVPILLVSTAPAAAPAEPSTGSVKALLERARGQSERLDTKGALRSLQEARALAPNSEDVLSALAEAAMAAGEPVTAIPVLEGLTRMCSSVGHYHYLLGVALLRSGDTAAAVLPLREAQRLEPDEPPVLIALGSALNDRNLYDEARSHLLHALSLDPDDLEAMAELAVAEEGQGDAPEAEAHARRVLARDADHATASLVIGMLRMKDGRYEEARDALLKTVAADPLCSKAHYQLSLALGHLGDEAGANERLELYRRSVAEREERVQAVRAVTGFSMGGMQR